MVSCDCCFQVSLFLGSQAHVAQVQPAQGKKGVPRWCHVIGVQVSLFLGSQAHVTQVQPAQGKKVVPRWCHVTVVSK